MFILFKYIHYSTHLTMVVRKFVIGMCAPIDSLGVNKEGQRVIQSLPPSVGSELYRSFGPQKYEYTGTVTAVVNAGKASFNHIDGLNLFIPHGSSPIDPHLEVGMVHDDAWTVTVEFIDPIEQVICICGVNVRLQRP